VFPIACIGAAHIDRKGRAVRAILPGTSNPVTMRSHHGGVARNVAEGLARLGADVALVSRVGRDVEGDVVLAHLASRGVDVSAVTRSEACPTASYTALLSPDGELAVALADMAVYEEVAPELIDAARMLLARCRLWFMDANLPRPAVERLFAMRPAGTWIAADAVSVPKAERLAGLLRGIDFLFVNADEAARLSGLPVKGCEGAERAARRLIAEGAGTVFLSLGPRGNIAASGEGVVVLPPPTVKVCDVTGAGDALVAGTLFGLAAGRSIRDSFALGQGCAAIVLEGEASVPDALTLGVAAARAGLAWPG
jgi:pseudouridine kinase